MFGEVFEEVECLKIEFEYLFVRCEDYCVEVFDDVVFIMVGGDM